MTYTIRLRDHEGDCHVIQVSFSQLVSLMPSRPRDMKGRAEQLPFWRGELSLDGPEGNVKLVDPVID